MHSKLILFLFILIAGACSRRVQAPANHVRPAANAHTSLPTDSNQTLPSESLSGGSIRPAASATPSAPVPVEGGTVKDTLTVENLPEDLFLNIAVRDFGTMKARLYTRDAPKNVTNVANLAIKGFYNGLTFHRLVPGFVLQGGDPAGDGTGGPGYTVPAEIVRRHEKGSLAMARTPDHVNPERRSSGSQFYICLQPLPQLDGQYTVIGKLVDGFDVLDRIAQTPSVNQKPQQKLVMERVTVTTR
ncbi:MAG: peptidylprolyl isomerase [candidate division WOR-3 bacterium]